MKTNIFLLFLMLVGCTPISTTTAFTSTPIYENTPVPLSPTPETPTLTPTPDPLTQLFNDLQAEGINVTHLDENSEGGWGLIVNGEAIPGATFDESGEILHLQIGEEQYDIQSDQVLERIDLVDGVTVVRDNNLNKFAAFDPTNVTETWGGKWFLKSEVMAVVETYDNAISVGNTWVEFNEHMKLEQAFMEPFAEDTYYPSSIVIDYENHSFNESGQAIPTEPFGQLAVGYDEFEKLNMVDNLPFRGVNCKLLAPNPEEERNGWMFFAVEQVFDPNNPKNIQALQLAGEKIKGPEDLKGKNGKDGVCGVVASINYGAYLMPRYAGSTDFSNGRPIMTEIYKRNGYWNERNGLIGIDVLVRQWLESGVIPDELRKIPLAIIKHNFW